jgi:hypothetical protein
MLFFSTLSTTKPTIIDPSPNYAYAQCDNCICVNIFHSILRSIIRAEHQATRLHITIEFIKHRAWWVFIYFNNYILKALMMMTEQLSAGAMQQMQIIGSFMDAQNQLETQMLFQRLAARAHKDYQPSIELCEIGTTARALAAADRRGEFNSIVMARRMQDRQLTNMNSIAADGTFSDIRSRINIFRSTFCDINDNNRDQGAPQTGLEIFCNNNSGPADRVNNDVDFTRTAYLPLTVDVRFDDGVVQNDETDILALAMNLYANNAMNPIPINFITVPPNYGSTPLVQPRNDPTVLLDVRAVTAKRSVAHNSFANLVAMKSASGVIPAAAAARDPYPFMASILNQLGVTNDAEIEEIIGLHPSYYAQMEVLTKKMYQRPEFYTNLYGKPANVQRVSAAMRAIGLMQNMDMFESRLRSEAALSVLLELKIDEVQQEIMNRGSDISTNSELQ